MGLLDPVKRFIVLRKYKFLFFHRSFRNRPFRLLDVGSGNHAASKAVFAFPNCAYHGLDLDKNYNNDARDFAAMQAFYELDLTQLDYSTIPDNYFDAISMAHVIEHLHNGDEVLKRLLPKLKSGGYFYIEYPCEKSTRLPSMYGTLNFYDDHTHVRIYTLNELKTIFESHGCTVQRAAVRRNVWNMLLTPLTAIESLITYKRVTAGVLWDWYGFAEYLYVKKN
jgi:ubiquinone/menaquinone biosynthesis C-methylase UbiE